MRSRGPGAPSGPAGKRASAGERQELPVGHSSGAQDEAQALGPGSWALWGWEPSVTQPPSRRRVPGIGRQCRSPAGVQGRVCASVRRGQVICRLTDSAGLQKPRQQSSVSPCDHSGPGSAALPNPSCAWGAGHPEEVGKVWDEGQQGINTVAEPRRGW